MKIDLKDVTLCVADSVTPDLSIRAIKKSQEQCNFGRSILFTDADILSDGSYDVVKINKLKSINDYSYFIIKDLNSYINTKFVLIIQWDGYVIDANMWQDDFLRYDYIGAKWDWHNDSNTVGNGGFSLRSKRLLEATSSIKFEFLRDIPEDVQICRMNKKILEHFFSIKFSKEDVADIFSYERSTPKFPTFGFHGFFNMWRHIDDSELVSLVESLSSNTLASREYFELILIYYKLQKFKEINAMYKSLKKIMTPNQFLNRLSSLTGSQEFSRVFVDLCENLIFNATRINK